MSKRSPTWTRLGWAIVGQVLPQAPVLRVFLRHTYYLVAAACFSALMAAGLVAIAGFGLYDYMLSEGVSHAGALAVCSGILLLLLVIALQQGSAAAQRISLVKRELGLFNGSKGSPTESPIESVIAEFLDGLLLSSESEPEKEVHIIRKTRVEKPDVTLVKNEFDTYRD